MGEEPQVFRRDPDLPGRMGGRWREPAMKPVEVVGARLDGEARCTDHALQGADAGVRRARRRRAAGVDHRGPARPRDAGHVRGVREDPRSRLTTKTKNGVKTTNGRYFGAKKKGPAVETATGPRNWGEKRNVGAPGSALERWYPEPPAQGN